LLVGAAAFAQTARVVLRWKPVENAKRYQIQIARDDSFKDVVVDTMVDTPGYRWDELPNVTYHWRVRSFDADERPSQWSAPRAISAAAGAPAVKQPAENASIDCRFEGVDLAVEAQSVFKEYVLQISEDGSFAGNVQQQSNTTGRFKVVLAPGVWHWRVRAIDVAGRETESTPARTLTVALAAPRTRPTPDVLLGTKDVTLAWEDVPCASRYQVEAALEDDPPVPVAASGTSTGFKTVRAGEYRWRVAALDARGAPGAFSAWTNFRVRLPGPRAGADVNGREVALTWAQISGVVGYRVEVSASSDFRPLAQQAVVDGNAWRPEPLPPGTYYWRVFARDASNKWSLPSEVRRWAVPDPMPPAAPEIVEPGGGKIARPDDGALSVRWSEPQGAATFDLQLDDGPVLSLTETSHTFSSVAAGGHTVKVRARGPGGTPSAWVSRHFAFGLPKLSRVELEKARVVLGGPKVLLRLRAYDDDGQMMSSGALEVTAKKGALGEPRLEWMAIDVLYTPPPLSARIDADVLHVSAAGFQQDLEVPLERGNVALAANVGGRFNGGAVVSPTIDLGVIFVPGWFSRRLQAEARLGFYAVGAKLDLPQGFPVEVAVELLPVSLLLAWNQPLFGLEWRLSAGFALQFAFIQLDGEGSFTAVPSVDLGIGAATPLGPGAVEARVQFLYGHLATPHVLLEAGGIGVTLGYRIDLPALGH
jgi:hypothetical protein